MPFTITAHHVENVLYDAIGHLACNLAPDVRDGLARAYKAEQNPLAADVLSQLLRNERVARTDRVPICQDTGSVWVCLEIGPDVCIAGDVAAGVDAAVVRAYADFALRKSIVADAYADRLNTGTNAPAFVDVHFVDEPGAARLHVMLKGGGSDNASQLLMLTPAATDDDIVAAVVERVRAKGANACPPLVIGVGIGGTFDKVAGLSKTALMRPLGTPAANQKAAALESAILEAVNASGIGPGGVGGTTTALAVHVQTAPCHIAALPVAINLCCCALRRTTIDLAGHTDASAADSPQADPIETASAPSDDAIRLQLPLDKEQLATLAVGDRALLSGPLYCLRDAGHARLLAELRQTGELPFGLAGQTIFYAGPTPPAAGRPFGAVGPTTASRMDFAAPELYDAGIVATIGKGKRSDAVVQACIRNKAVYFGAAGGAAAFLAKCVESSQTLGYDDLGTEALRRIEVTDFPVFVAIDASGAALY